MKDIFYTRALIINIIKRYESYIVFAAKFIAGIVLYSFIFSIGMYREELAFLFSMPLSVPFIVLLAASFAFFPATANYLLMAAIVAAQFSASLEAASLAFLLMICMVIFYVRLSPKKSYLILAVLVAFYFRVPYAVVLFAGLYVGVASILPIALGTFVFYFAPNIIQVAEYMKTAEEIDLLELPVRFVDSYTLIFENLTSNYTWVITTFIFAIAILGIYAISKLTIDFVKEISIAFGGIVCIMCLILASIVIEDFQLSILSVIFGTIGSVVMVAIIRFFDDLPDYQRTENVKFEDDDNYYYCKIVPKLVVPETLKTNLPARKRPSRETRDRIRQHNDDRHTERRSGEPRSPEAPPEQPKRRVIIPSAVPPPRKPEE